MLEVEKKYKDDALTQSQEYMEKLVDAQQAQKTPTLCEDCQGLDQVSNNIT